MLRVIKKWISNWFKTQLYYLRTGNPKFFLFPGCSLVVDFESPTYSTGNLNGQDSWSGDTNFQVQTSLVNSGSQAVSVVGASARKTISKDFASGQADGNQVFYWRCNSQSDDYQGQINIYNESGEVRMGISFNNAPSMTLFASGWPSLSTWAVDTWYKIEFEWRSSDYYFRARVDDGTWTDWMAAYDDGGTDWTTIDGITLVMDGEAGSGTTTYWDDFSDPNASSSSSSSSSSESSSSSSSSESSSSSSLSESNSSSSSSESSSSSSSSESSSSSSSSESSSSSSSSESSSSSSSSESSSSSSSSESSSSSSSSESSSSSSSSESSSSSSSSESSSSSSSSESSSSSSSEVNKNYSSGDYASLPANDDDLENSFSSQDYIDVEEDDDNYVQQCATDEFWIFEWKDKGDDNTKTISLTWKGKTNLAPSQSAVYLQIYNRTTEEWETLDSDNLTNADTEFTLTGSQQNNLDDYYDGSNWVSCRVYQEAK